MLKHVKKILPLFMVVLISIVLGYVLRLYHEGKIRSHYQSQAEKEIATLEEEFHSAWRNPRTFYIFNGRFEVYPLRESDRTFFYRELKDVDVYNRDTEVSKNIENR
jgi:hypothetical protein